MEQIEFRKLLPSELVTAQDDARSRQKPLAGPKLASVFSSGFKSKFTKGAFAEEDADGGNKVWIKFLKNLLLVKLLFPEPRR